MTTVPAVRVDEQCRAWVDGDSTFTSGSPISGLSLHAEGSENGFILWLDIAPKFKARKLTRKDRLLPAIEYREVREEVA